MLPLLPDFLAAFSLGKLCVALSADGIALVQQTAGFKKNVRHQQHVKLNSSVAQPKWQSAISELDGLFSQLKLSKNTPVTIVLSSDFVRYLMLPAQPIAMSYAEKTAYANAAFHEVYGMAVNDWHIKCHDAAPHESTIAVAVDAQLITALNQLAVKYQLKLNSVQPYVMAAFNSLIKQTAQTNGYLVLTENSKLLLLQLQKGACQQLRTVAISHAEDGDWQADLNRAIQRELVLNDNLPEANKQLLIYAPAQKNQTLNKLDGWQTKRVGRNSLLSDARYAMLEVVL